MLSAVSEKCHYAECHFAHSHVAEGLVSQKQSRTNNNCPMIQS
jgi:hypothetical protein